MLRLIARPTLLTMLVFFAGIITVRTAVFFTYIPINDFTHPDCTQPCLFGIQAGHTSRAEAEQILMERGISYFAHPSYDRAISESLTFTMNNRQILLAIRRDTIEEIHIRSHERCAVDVLALLHTPQRATVNTRYPLVYLNYTNAGLSVVYEDSYAAWPVSDSNFPITLMRTISLVRVRSFGWDRVLPDFWEMCLYGE